MMSLRWILLQDVVILCVDRKTNVLCIHALFRDTEFFAFEAAMILTLQVA